MRIGFTAATPLWIALYNSVTARPLLNKLGRLIQTPLSSHHLVAIATASAAAGPTASTRTWFHWFGFVHGQGPAIHLCAV